MPSVSVIQRLLAAGEYDELEDVVITEGQFVEIDFAGFAIRQVILAITATSLLVAEQQILDYKLNPEVYYDTTVDPYMEGLEVTSALPLCVIRLTASRIKYGLTVNIQGYERYFEMANTSMNDCIEDVWQRWLERVDYLVYDPYNYIKHMYDTYHLPYPSYYLHATKDPTMPRATLNDGVNSKTGQKVKAKLDERSTVKDTLREKNDKKERKKSKKKKS